MKLCRIKKLRRNLKVFLVRALRITDLVKKHYHQGNNDALYENPLIHHNGRKSSEDNRENERKLSSADRLSSSDESNISIPRHSRPGKMKEKYSRNAEDPDLKELEKKIAARLGSLYTEKTERKMSSAHNENEGLMFDVGLDKRMASALKR